MSSVSSNAVIASVIYLALADMDLFVHQSRTQFDEAEIKSLAENMRTHGQLQPGVVWFDPGRNRYIVICGERRYRALKLNGAATMAVTVIEGELSLSRMLEINISENLQRTDLNPIERGQAFLRLKQAANLTAKEVAERLNVTDAMVSRHIALLDLPSSLQAKVISGELPASVASHLVRLDDEEARRELADRYGAGELSRDGVASEVKQRLKGQHSGANASALALRVEGVAVSFKAGKKQPLTLDALLKAIACLQKAIKTISDSKGDIGMLADSFKAI